MGNFDIRIEMASHALAFYYSFIPHQFIPSILAFWIEINMPIGQVNDISHEDSFIIAY